MKSNDGKPVRVDLETLKATVDGLLKERQLPEKWLYQAVGMSKTGYREMWQRGSVKATTIQAMADAFRLTLEQLLGGHTPAAAPMAMEPAAMYNKRYLEDRVFDLEQRIQALERSK